MTTESPIKNHRGKRQKADAAQAEFPFDRKERFELLRMAIDKLPDSVVLNDSGRERRGFRGTLKKLIETLELCSNSDGCFARQEVLAAHAGTSRRTIQRYLTEAEDLGWVEVVGDRCSASGGGQIANQYRLDWMKIRSDARRETGQLSLFRDAPVRHQVAPVRLHDAPVRLKDAPIYGINPVINPPVNPPPPPERDSPPENPTYSNPDPPWAAVEEKLLAIGLYHAGSVCLQAREQGVKPFFVRAIIEYWEANKDLWGLGALTERIRRARPDQDVGRHWPPADPKGLEVRSRFESLSARERQQAQEREREVQANERRKREAELVEQLERDVGPILDGLSDQERGALETRAFDPIELQILARGQPLFGYREKLLKRLDHERQENARSPDVDCGEPGVAG